MLKLIITFTLLCTVVHCTHPESETHAPETTASHDTNKEYSALRRRLELLEFSLPEAVPGSEEARIHPFLRRSSQASTQNGPDDSDKLTVEIKPAKYPTEAEISDIKNEQK